VVKTGSFTFRMFKSSITMSLLLAVPVVLFFGINLYGVYNKWSDTLLIISGVMSMVMGFSIIGFHYYWTASKLLGKTALNMLQWDTPSHTSQFIGVMKRLEYLGTLKNSNPAKHLIYIDFEEEDLPKNLVISPCHPNDLVLNPEPDWIPYKGLIYPASVAPFDVVKLTTLKLKDGFELNVVYPLASSWHAKQIQAKAVGGNGSSIVPEDVKKGVKILDRFLSIENEEKVKALEGQVGAYRKIVEDFEKRVAEMVARFSELEEQAKKPAVKTLGEKLFLSKRRKIGFIVGLVAVIIGLIAVAVGAL